MTFPVFVTNRLLAISIVHGFSRGHLVFSVVVLPLAIVSVVPIRIASLILSGIARIGPTRAGHLDADFRQSPIASARGIVLTVRLIAMGLWLRRLRVSVCG